MAESRRHAIVTGGAKGIGRGIAEALLAAGYAVTVFDVDAEALDGLRQAHADAPLRAVTCDVADRDAVHAAVEQAVAWASGLDVLVNNAVRFHFAPLVEMTPEVVRGMLAVGLEGAVWCTQAATPHLVARGGGLVVFLSSMAVRIGIRNAGVYTAIKGALDALTRQQAVELAPHDIRVNAIAPGSVPTPGARSVIDEAGWEARRARAPLGRLATPEEIGAAVVWLASDAARSITGVTLPIDAGMTVAGP